MSDQLSKNLLTQELRVQFQALGEKSVQRDVSNHNYGRADKHRAALHWLAEMRQARMTREKHMLWVAVAAIVLMFIGVILAFLQGRPDVS